MQKFITNYNQVTLETVAEIEAFFAQIAREYPGPQGFHSVKDADVPMLDKVRIAVNGYVNSNPKFLLGQQFIPSQEHSYLKAQLTYPETRDAMSRVIDAIKNELTEKRRKYIYNTQIAQLTMNEILEVVGEKFPNLFTGNITNLPTSNGDSDLTSSDK